VERTHSKILTADIYYRPMIEEREDRFKFLLEQQPLGNVVCKAIVQEDLDRKHPDIVSSDPFPKGTRASRNTRSSNAQKAKPVTSLLSGMQYNDDDDDDDDDDAYLGSPARYPFPSHNMATLVF